MKRKMISMLLVLILVLSVIPLSAAAVTGAGTCGENISWELDADGVLRIFGTGFMDGANGTLPWEDLRGNIKQVVVEVGVNGICAEAFRDCDNLTDVSLPSSLFLIEERAFADCHSLEAVFLPEGLLKLAENVFEGCTNLSYVSLSETLQIIGAESFRGCESLQWMRFPASVTRIGDRAFYQSGLTRVHFDGTPQSIGEQAFDGGEALVAVFPGEAPEMGEYAFGDSALCYFPNYQNLLQYRVYADVDSQYELDCGYLADGTQWIFYNTGLLQLSSHNTLAASAADFSDFAKEVHSIEVTGIIFTLDDGALSGFESAYEVKLPDEVNHIGNNAFRGCTALRELKMPQQICIVGEGAFGDCTSLRKLELQWDCPDIDPGAFSNVKATAFYVEGMLYYDSPVELQDGSLTWEPIMLYYGSAELSGENILWHLDENGCLYFRGSGDIPNGTPGISYERHPWTSLSENVKRVKIGEGITSVPRFAFSEFGNLVTVALPSTITRLSQGVFENCTSLRNINLPESLTELGNGTFEGCSSMERLELPSGIVEIPSACFTGCEYLMEVTLPANLEVIGEQAFQNCCELDSIVIPETVTEIGYCAFGNDSELKKVTFTGDVPTMDTYAFSGTELTFYYPADRSSWTEDVMVSYGAREYQWVAYEPVGEPCLHTWVDSICTLCGESCTHSYVGNVCGDCGALLDAESQCVATLIGSINGWSSEPNMTVLERDTLYASLELEPGTYLFKIKYNGTVYGTEKGESDSTMNFWDTVDGGYACRVQVDHPGTYEIHFSTTSHRARFYYIPETMYVVGSEEIFGTGLEMRPYGEGYYTASFILDKGVYNWVFTDPDGYVVVMWDEYEVQDLSKITTSMNIYSRWSMTSHTLIEDPMITPKYPTLSFEDEISMNVYFDAVHLAKLTTADMGLICFDTADTDGTIETASAVMEGAVKDSATGLYMVRTDSIPAKDLSKTKYFKIYIECSDGSYVYSNLLQYSPMSYAASQFGDAAAPTAMKALVSSMLSYGGAAQRYFGSDEAYADADLTEEQKAYIESYRSDMVASVVKPDATKLGDFAATETGFDRCYPTISFEGAFAINYYFAPNAAPVENMTLYYWDEEAYGAAESLTADNATGCIPMTLDDNGEYTAAVENIAAKDLDKTVYVAAVYSDGTTRYCSGVLSYSIGAYCVSQAREGKPMQALAAATAVYGYYAKQYFANPT